MVLSENSLRGRRLCALVGPNASGKSDLAIAMAEKFQGEIISADSRQVYRGMNLGSGKVPGRLLSEEGINMEVFGRSFFSAPLLSGGVRHWLIDIVDPADPFTAAEFQQLAYGHIENIIERGRTPFLAGGTGLYIRAVLDGLNFPRVPPHEELRRELENYSTEELQRQLLLKDPEAGKAVDMKNRRRLIRALEIMHYSNEPLAILKTTVPVPFQSFTLGITMPREALHDRIKQRLARRLEKGMVDEVRQLMREGVSGDRLVSFGLEYRYIYYHLAGELTREAMEEELFRAICRFAKRQFTWFRKYGNVHWLSSKEEAFEMAGAFLSGNPGN
jgi:tRNA dimethylallyltransferase